MHDLGAALGRGTFPEILPSLPIEGCLEGVFDAEGAAFDEEHVLVEGGGNGEAREGLDEFGEIRGVDIGVGWLVECDVGEAVAKFGSIKTRMVVTDRTGSEVGEEIEHRPPALGIEDPRALRLFEIHDDVVAVRQHVPAEHAVDLGGLNDNAAVGYGGQRHEVDDIKRYGVRPFLRTLLPMVENFLPVVEKYEGKA